MDCQPGGGKVKQQTQLSSHERPLAHSRRKFIVFVLRTLSATVLAKIHSDEKAAGREKRKMERKKKEKKGKKIPLVTRKVQKHWLVRAPVGQNTAIFPQIKRVLLY